MQEDGGRRGSTGEQRRAALGQGTTRPVAEWPNDGVIGWRGFGQKGHGVYSSFVFRTGAFLAGTSTGAVNWA